MKISPITAAFFAATTLLLPAGLAAQDDHGDNHHFQFKPDSLVLSRSYYVGTASSVTIGETLPLGCQGGLTGLTINVPTTTGGTTPVTVPCGIATDNGEYANVFDTHNVFNNANSDGSLALLHRSSWITSRRMAIGLELSPSLPARL